MQQSDWYANFKRVMRKYGPVALTFHTTVYFCSLGMVYVGVRNGLDLTWIIELAEKYVLPVQVPEQAGALAVAYVFNSTLLGPPRAVITAVATPVLAPTVAGQYIDVVVGKALNMRRKKKEEEQEEGKGGGESEGDGKGANAADRGNGRRP